MTGRESHTAAFVGLAVMLLCASTQAAEPTTLWRVERTGIAANYLLVVTEQDREIPSEVERVARAARTLVIATELSSGAFLAALPAALDEQTKRIAPTIDPTLHRRALSQLHSRGIAGQASRLKPWALGLALSAPAPTEDSLELRITRMAVGRRQQIVAVESLAERMSALDTLSKTQQEAMLRAALARGSQSPTMIETAYSAWKLGDQARLQQLAFEARTRLERFRTEAQQQSYAARLDAILHRGAAVTLMDQRQLATTVKFLRRQGWDVVALEAKDLVAGRDPVQAGVPMIDMHDFYGTARYR